MSSEEKAHIFLETVDDRKAENPVLIDLRDKHVMLADFFIVCTGLAVPHIRAIAEHVLEKVDELNLPKPTVSGEEVAEWVLLDFGDIVLHIMSEEARTRYRLEEFWSTPQPKGALPPTPGSVPDRYPLDRGPVAEPEALADEDEEEDDDSGFEEYDDDDFFAEADTEVEPVDEEEEVDAAPDAPTGRTREG